MSEELKSAQARIACLEGEIAKRDEELAACRVAVENCELFRARIAELEARIVWLECEAQGNAAPVSEAKAQGVVMPTVDQAMRVVLREMGNSTHVRGTSNWCADVGRAVLEEVARLNATPVQQASVPDAVEVLRAVQGQFNRFGERFPDGFDSRVFRWVDDAVAAYALDAAPSAPAADALLVEALKQAFPLFDEDGLNELYHHCEIAVLGDRKRLHKLLAAHSAKGVL